MEISPYEKEEVNEIDTSDLEQAILEIKGV